MKPLPEPDLHCLRAAMGWLELGDHVEANGELDRIDPEHWGQPEVLRVRWEVFRRAAKWNTCLNLGRALVRVAPEQLQSWLTLAQSLSLAVSDQAAYALLESKIPDFPRESALYYAAARFACRADRPDKAQELLELAMLFGDAETLRRRALEDLDLQLLWPEGPLPL